MGKTYVLDRVASDLAHGLTHPAIQRLSSLVAAYPTDLDLRRRLAAAYRRVGNQIQAGRWDYLTIGADTTDTSAFERAFPSAAARLRAIRWPHRAAAAPTSYARSRLAKLVAAAEAESPRQAAPPGTTTSPEPVLRQADPAGLARLRGFFPLAADRTANWALLAAAGLATALLVAVGVVTVIEWIIQ